MADRSVLEEVLRLLKDLFVYTGKDSGLNLNYVNRKTRDAIRVIGHNLQLPR